MALSNNIADGASNAAVSSELITLIQQARTDDLFIAINSSELKEITRLLSDGAKAKLKSEIALTPAINARHKKSQAILASFTEGPSIPFYMLGVIAGSVTIAFTSMVVLTGSLFAIMLIAGGIHAVGTYQELKDKDEEDHKLFQFTQFRLACANELLARLRKEAAARQLDADNQINSALPAYARTSGKTADDMRQDLATSNERAPLLGTRMAPRNKKKKSEKATWLPRFKDSLGTSFVLGLIIFESYYLSAIALSQALTIAAVAGVLTGGIGLGVALGITILISGYLGYKHYQHNKQREAIQREQDELQKQLTSTYKECYKLKEQLNQNHKLDMVAPPYAPDYGIKAQRKVATKFNTKRNAIYYANNVNNLFKSTSQKILMRRSMRIRYGGSSFKIIRRH